jgi:Zn-dependent protease
MRSLTLGRVQDIEVKLHPTFGLVVLWVLFDWGNVGPSRLTTALYGLLLVSLVFACVLLHELGHSFMAMHYGVRVHDVTLSAIGGVARIEQVPTSPRAEVLIALAGPAINVAIAVALLPLVALVTVATGAGDLGRFLVLTMQPSLAGLLVGLFFANLAIVLFNLLPAFPMDGGRLLRAGLSAAIGRESGTRVAVAVGQALAVALAVADVIWLRSFSLLLISLFIVVVAHAEGKAVRLESAMRRLRVGQFALWDMGGIAPHLPLSSALRGGPRDLAVIEHGRVVGVLWRHQLLHELQRGGHARPIADVMDREFVTANIHDSVFDVQQQMNRHHRWAIPILEDGLYRGIFTADRFVHVYRQLSPPRFQFRYRGGIVNAISDLLHGSAR